MNNKSVSLKVQNVTKTFAIPGGSKVVAVNDCSFTAAPGEFVTLLGAIRVRQNNPVAPYCWVRDA